MINSYLSSSTDLDDAAIHLLFSANRWEKKCVRDGVLCRVLWFLIIYLSMTHHSAVYPINLVPNGGVFRH